MTEFEKPRWLKNADALRDEYRRTGNPVTRTAAIRAYGEFEDLAANNDEWVYGDMQLFTLRHSDMAVNLREAAVTA